MSKPEDKKPVEKKDENEDINLDQVSGAGDYGLSASETSWNSSTGWKNGK